jgi:nicotinamide mononucleotide transporter
LRVSPFETLAALVGVVAVFLSTRQNVWSWPVGIVYAGMYVVVFAQARLLASAVLHVVYLVLSVYGWWAWLRGDEGSPLLVTRARRRTILAAIGLALVVWLSLGTLLRNETTAALPYLDSLLTCLSLVAQWMLARKILENWAIWILLDLAYVPMYLSQGLEPTAGLYGVYLGLAIKGWVDWRSSLRLTPAQTHTS